MVSLEKRRPRILGSKISVRKMHMVECNRQGKNVNHWGVDTDGILFPRLGGFLLHNSLEL